MLWKFKRSQGAPGETASAERPYLYRPEQPEPAETPDDQQDSSYGYPPQRPRSLGAAMYELPTQYVKILTRPGVRSFLEEQGKADWRANWVQMLFMGLLGSIIGLLQNAAVAPAGSFAATTMYFARFSIITVPISFLITVGIQYLLARALRGTGTYKTQVYNQLLCAVPLTVLTYMLQLIPVVGAILGLIVGIYELVLNIYAVMAAHRLGGGKAALAVLLPVLVLFVLTTVALSILALQHTVLVR